MEEATLILKIELFCNLVFLLMQKLTILYFKVLVTLSKLLFLEISFLRIIYKVITFPNVSFRLARKPYQKLCEISTKGCVARMLGSG